MSLLRSCLFCFRRSRSLEVEVGKRILTGERSLLTNNHHYAGNIFLILLPDVVIVMVSY